jgi:hypothetical protein
MQGLARLAQDEKQLCWAGKWELKRHREANPLADDPLNCQLNAYAAMHCLANSTNRTFRTRASVSLTDLKAEFAKGRQNAYLIEHYYLSPYAQEKGEEDGVSQGSVATGAGRNDHDDDSDGLPDAFRGHSFVVLQWDRHRYDRIESSGGQLNRGDLRFTLQQCLSDLPSARHTEAEIVRLMETLHSQGLQLNKHCVGFQWKQLEPSMWTTTYRAQYKHPATTMTTIATPSTTSTSASTTAASTAAPPPPPSLPAPPSLAPPSSAPAAGPLPPLPRHQTQSTTARRQGRRISALRAPKKGQILRA